RIKTLENLIKKYQTSYYNGEAEISDSEFDLLWDELKMLDSNNPILQKVGSDSGNFEKARNVMPMGSQEKAANPEEFFAWSEKHKYSEYLVEYKLDGASLELQYEDGNFLRAVTRGDGKVGDVISQNAKMMKGVLQKLSSSFTGGVRGEVVMLRDVHKKKYSDKANCRNAANGIMKRKDGKGCSDLSFISYDALSTETSSPFGDEEEKIKWLLKMGFETVPLEICKSAEDVVLYREKVMKERENLPYDIDGLVVKEREINLEDANRSRPDRQIAFKFSLDSAITTLRSVEWIKSGGTYTPVAIFDSVELAGTTVQRASLANPDTMRKLNVKIGSSVVVVKRGEIIPKIESVLPSNNITSEIVFPVECEVCKTKLIDEGSRLFCPNKMCKKRILHQLLKWISTVDIRDLGETLITNLFNENVVQSISDIYKLNLEVLSPFFLNEESLNQEKESLGAKKVLASISAKRSMPLSTFVAGFDIEGIGEAMAEKLVESGFNSLEKLLNATESDFANVHGFAEKLAHAATEGLKENAEEMRTLVLSNVIQLQSVSSGLLQGKSFCFTGELFSMKRSEAEKLVKENGGTCKSSVTKDLTYLVTNNKDSGSSKNEKATKLNVTVIDEKEFLKLLGK
ncbi:MAG: NAD-dependent DNA ligase LigA, partial [Treponema sp.]|nr:NAD-dependent DNA ligase LigA [Treponema sp.]